MLSSETNSAQNQVTGGGLRREYPGPLSSAWLQSSEPSDMTEDLRDANTALFYSISSPHKGLTGIELGMSMIREVSKKINDEFPAINTFATLSPIPGFRDHLLDQISEVLAGKTHKVEAFANEMELMSLENWVLEQKDASSLTRYPNVWHMLHDVIKSNSWINDEDLIHRLQIPLMRKCAHYLYHEKKKGYVVNTVGQYILMVSSCAQRVQATHVYCSLSHNDDSHAVDGAVNRFDSHLRPFDALEKSVPPIRSS